MDEKHYSDPALRQRLKDEIQAGDKGGHPGQWSARKSQLLAHEYEKAGGQYIGPKSEDAKHLDEWTKEEWHTKDGEKAQKADGSTARYLPDEAWNKLTPAQQKATDDKKRAHSKQGEQYVENTEAAKHARSEATEKK